MFSFEKIQIMGNVGSVGKEKICKSGYSVCSFSVAVNRYIKVSDNNYDTEVVWYECVCFGNMIEKVTKFIKKGDKVVVFGAPKISQYINKNDEHVAALSIFVKEFYVCSAKNKDTDAKEEPEIQISNNKNNSVLDDDIPF